MTPRGSRQKGLVQLETDTEFEDHRLDGNAAAGLLAEVFQIEMTVSSTTCAHCGTHGEMGRLIVYVRAPGTVFRCSICGHVQMKIVSAPGRYFVDMSGVRTLEITGQPG
jgi:hypothetical protein